MCPSRITAVLVHPNRNKLIVLAGDKEGYVGLWDVNNRTDETGDRVLNYQPHSTNVTKFHCSESDGSKIYSASYDGTIRCWDTNTHAFVMSFDASDKTDTWYITTAVMSPRLWENLTVTLLSQTLGRLQLATSGSSRHSCPR
jgi:WD40 repeat protein